MLKNYHLGADKLFFFVIHRYKRILKPMHLRIFLMFSLEYLSANWTAVDCTSSTFKNSANVEIVLIDYFNGSLIDAPYIGWLR